jgi:transcriptional regulator with XRE-family HTH domain
MSNDEKKTTKELRLDRKGLGLFLQRMARQAGGLEKLAADFGVSHQFLSDVINGKKKPGNKIMQKLNGRVEKAPVVYVISRPSEGESNESE